MEEIFYHISTGVFIYIFIKMCIILDFILFSSRF